MAAVQSFPTSAQVIYDTLASDAAFTSLLGSYDFKTGQGSITALSIVSAGEDLPSLRNVQGVECIIQDTGDMNSRDYLTGSSDIRTDWSLFLVAWEPSKGVDLHAAAQHVLKRFHGSTAVQTVAATDGLGALVQTKVMISSENAIISI